MKNTVKITVGILIIAFGVILYWMCFSKKEYSTNLYYMDTYIYIKFDTSNASLAKKALKEINNIYKEYHELSDRFNHYDGIINVYDIKNNEIDADQLEISPKLYNILELASNWHEKNSQLNIEIGNVIDVWKGYRDNKNGVPTMDELESANHITNLVLLGNNTIKNNHPNLDLGAVSKGYATQMVGNYLIEIGIKDYLINAGGNVLVGNNYKNVAYKIGVQSPVAGADLMTVVKGTNISVVTSGGYERNYEYDGKTYHHIIDPETLYPSNYMKSVTVITKDSAIGDLLSTTLFLMSVEEGQEYIKNFDAEAIWYTNDDELIRSDGFSAYE